MVVMMMMMMMMMMIHNKSEAVVHGCANDMVVCMHMVMATTQGCCKDVSTLLLVLFLYELYHIILLCSQKAKQWQLFCLHPFHFTRNRKCKINITWVKCVAIDTLPKGEVDLEP